MFFLVAALLSKTNKCLTSHELLIWMVPCHWPFRDVKVPHCIVLIVDGLKQPRDTWHYLYNDPNQKPKKKIVQEMTDVMDEG